MRRILVLTFAVATILALAVPVGATPPSEVEIHNLISDVFDPAPTPFIASGGIVCDSGTVEGVGFMAAGRGNNGVNFQVIKKFTCDDGDFFLKLQVRLSFATGNTAFNWNVVGGTGAYEDLHGSGRGVGTACGPFCVEDHYEGGLHLD